jgi:hypothetical protein
MDRQAKALPVGRFRTREELTCHVWSIHRQQVFPNIHAIAESCGIHREAVNFVLRTEEGLEDYLQRGCLTG